MAVAKMKKLSLIGLQSEKDSILRDIAFTGSVEFTDLSASVAEECWTGLVTSDSPETEISVLEEQMSAVKTALDALSPYAPKKGLFSSPPAKTRQEFDLSVGTRKTTLEVVHKICSNLKEQAEAESKINSLRQSTISLLPWATLDVPMSLRGTNWVKIIYGILPVFDKFDVIERELAEKAEEIFLQSIHTDKQNNYVQIICFKSVVDDVLEVLKLHSFIEASFEGHETTVPATVIAKYDSEIKRLVSENEKQQAAIVDFAASLPEIEFLFDSLVGVLQTKYAKSRLLITGETFYIEGYVPSAFATEFEKILSKYTLHLELTDPSEEDDTPTLLQNTSLVEPYEMVTSMYSLPKYATLDPNTVVAPFFCVFFGMMLSDAGYGLILFLLGLFVLKKMKPTGTVKRMMGLLVQGGLSSIVAGIVYGSYFGDVIPVVSNTFFHNNFTIKAFFDPMANPMTMLYVCVALGAVQIITGMGVQGYQLIKEGKWLDAIFDIGFWYVVFSGIIVLIFAGTVGLAIAGVGALGLVLTQGRSKKGIISKFTSGLLSLYGITGYMSDLLSYSRLMALGLSTGVIASVFNKLGALAGGSIVGAIFFIIIFIIGQVFNLAMGALGAYVHSSRLTYVEYFGKFYSGGGREFTPLKFKNKYVALSSREENQ